MNKSLRVLLVEDLAERAELLRGELLRSRRNTVCQRVADPASLQVALAQNGWDLVIASLDLPALSAQDALAAVRAADPDVPFLILGGSAGREAAAELMAAGAADYFRNEDLWRLGPVVERELRAAVCRRARRGLEAEAQFLRTSMRSAEDAVYARTLDGTLSGWNPAAERLFGWTAEEVLGRPVTLLVPPDLLEEVSENLKSVRRGQTCHYETERLHQDGTRLPVCLKTTPVYSPEGRLVGSSVIAGDLREARRMAAARERDTLLLSNVRDVVIVTDLEGKITYWNEGASRLLGWSAAEMVGRSYEDRFPAEVRGEILRRLSSGEGSTLWDGEFPDCRKDGSSVWLDARISLMHDAEGNPIGLLAIAHDITDRKASEQELQRRDSQYRVLAESIPQLVWMSSPDGALEYVSEKWEKFCGCPANELYGWEWQSLIHPDDMLPSMQAFQRALEAESTLEVEYRLRGAGGAYRWFLSQAVPIRGEGGEVVAWCGTCTDIEERKQEYVAQARLAAIIESSEDAIISTTPEGLVQSWNAGAEQLYGFSAEEMLGETLTRIIPLDEFYSRGDAVIARVLAGRPLSGLVTRGRRRDGSPVDISLTLFPIRDRDGKVIGVSSMSRDITEQLRLETERRLLEEQLQQAQKMEAIGQLAGGVAHDFNNLLAVINGYSAIVLECLNPGDRLWEFVDEVKKAGERAERLTRQLLAFSRSQVLAPKVLDPNELVGDLQKLLTRLIGEDILLETDLRAEATVFADPGQLEQVLINLAVNARDAMPRGGRLRIETGEMLRAEAPDTAPARFVQISFQDWGCGMTAEVRSRIFEPFFTTKDPGKGTGLGLAVVHGIVSQSGGRIEVESEPGEGTMIRILLPVCAAEPVSLERPGPGRAPRGGWETVLLVEDDDAVRGFAGRILEDAGYRVLSAAGAAEALALAERHDGPIHILATDVVMPGCSGRELAEELCRLRPNLSVLYLSGYTDDAVVRHGVLLDEVHFLPKPYSREELMDKVRAVLDDQAYSVRA